MVQLRPHADYVKLRKRGLERGEIKVPAPEQTGWHDGAYQELDIRSIDCSGMDLSGYDADAVCFDDDTRFPAAGLLPKDFDAAHIRELHKNPGLGVRSLHARGITGKGLSLAVIDQMLSSHREYDNQVALYEEFGYKNTPPSDRRGGVHGAAVASVAVGKTVGVAPDARLYYFAANNGMKDEKTGAWEPTAQYYAQALDRILEINASLPADKKIQAVSVSWAGQGNPDTAGHELWRNALKKAKKAGLFVKTCALGREYPELNAGINSLGRALYGAPDDSKSYALRDWADMRTDEEARRLLAFPAGHRTVASPTGPGKYVHYRNGGYSWATPFGAALFVLARQVNPAITPEQFFKKGLETGEYSAACKGVIVNPVKMIDGLQHDCVRAQVLRRTQGMSR